MQKYNMYGTVHSTIQQCVASVTVDRLYSGLYGICQQLCCQQYVWLFVLPDAACSA